MSDPEYRYQNALKWIRTIAGMHYLGGAFDPEHMRGIANLAADALAGKDAGDHDEAVAASQERAREMTGKFQLYLAGGDDASAP